MNPISKHQIKLHIIGFEGSIWSAEVKNTTKIDKLKSMAISHFYSLGIHKYSDSRDFSMLSVSKKLSLNEEMTVTQEDLKDNDEIILVKCRPERPEIEVDLRGPTVQDITEATKHLKKQNIEQQQPVCEVISNTEYHRILISLIKAAARLLSPSSEGMKIFNLLNEKIKKQGQPSKENPLVKQLTDMGFPLHRVLKALKLKKMNVSEATEWLLQQSSDSEGEEGEEQPSCSLSSVTTPKPQSVVEAFEGLLRSLLSEKKRQFLPNSKYLLNLKEMGFEEKDAKEALRISGNNQSAACSWLLGDKKRKKPDDAEEGIESDGPIYDAIIKDPIIQINLTKPKVLFAFLTILENPSAADLWINDDEIAPVLNQIFRTYQTEKLSKPSSDPLSGPHIHHGESPESSSSSQLTSLFWGNDEGEEDLDDEEEEMDDDEDEVRDLHR